MSVRFLKTLLFLALALAKPVQTASPKQSAPAPSSTPQPPPQIQSLTKSFAGKWTTQEKYEPLFLTPKGGTGRGQTIFRPGPGGFTLEEEYRTQTPAGPLYGFGLIWYDSTRNSLQHIWCINIYPDGCEMFPPPPQPGPQWDGKKLVLHVESDQGGKKMIFHEEISDITPNSYTQTADIGEPGQPLKRWFTIHATRVSNSGSKPAAPRP
jgi:hypothetical protein